MFDGLDTERAIGVAARKHDSDRSSEYIDSQRFEQRIHGKVMLECGAILSDESVRRPP